MFSFFPWLREEDDKCALATSRSGANFYPHNTGRGSQRIANGQSVDKIKRSDRVYRVGLPCLKEPKTNKEVLWQSWYTTLNSTNGHCQPSNLHYRLDCPLQPATPIASASVALNDLRYEYSSLSCTTFVISNTKCSLESEQTLSTDVITAQPRPAITYT